MNNSYFLPRTRKDIVRARRADAARPAPHASGYVDNTPRFRRAIAVSTDRTRPRSAAHPPRLWLHPVISQLTNVRTVNGLRRPRGGRRCRHVRRCCRGRLLRHGTRPRDSHRVGIPRQRVRPRRSTKVADIDRTASVDAWIGHGEFTALPVVATRNCVVLILIRGIRHWPGRLSISNRSLRCRTVRITIVLALRRMRC